MTISKAKLFKSYKPDGSILTDNQYVICTIDGVEKFVPTDNNNKDYQDYLAWVAEGNTPTAAD
tara:strand:+ start:310 stop:498 length:189 start_codon:yes stop_codon:yes gene_type:complete